MAERDWDDKSTSGHPLWTSESSEPSSGRAKAVNRFIRRARREPPPTMRQRYKMAIIAGLASRKLQNVDRVGSMASRWQRDLAWKAGSLADAMIAEDMEHAERG